MSRGDGASLWYRSDTSLYPIGLAINDGFEYLFHMETRICTWCKRQIPAGKRSDSKFCGQKCRQSSHRFAVAPAVVAQSSLPATGDTSLGSVAARAATPRRFAYADPPYPGKAHYYPEKTEVSHGPLIRRLLQEYPDGWALSTSADALLDVWCFCPDARLFVWVKKPRGKSKTRALSSFEVVLVHFGRKQQLPVAQDLRDVLIARGRHRSFPGSLIGMKPPAFCEWIFRLLGAQPGDQLDDLFPGSGAVGEAWRRFTRPGATAMKSVPELCVYQNETPPAKTEGVCV